MPKKNVLKIGSLIKFYILLLLNEKPKCGYDLMKELREKLGKDISPSQVYPFLNILEKNKFIIIEKKCKRDKKIYGLTCKGKELVKSFLQRFGELLDFAIRPRLNICAHCGCKIYKDGYMKKIGKKKLTFCCVYCAASFSKKSK